MIDTPPNQLGYEVIGKVADFWRDDGRWRARFISAELWLVFMRERR